MAYSFSHPEFGIVHLSQRSGMRSLSARWHNNELYINTPTRIEAKQILDFIEKNKEKIKAIRPAQLSYSFGQRIITFRHTVTIKADPLLKNRIGFKSEGNDIYLNLPDNTDLKRHEITKMVSSCISQLMAHRAQDTLIPFAQSIARNLGVKPHHFEIGRGMRKLGHCTQYRVIQLSYNLMFLPEPLVQYIVCHELAHLTHMNHSAMFHKLCDEYCIKVCGRSEKSLESILKGFSWPILR